MYCIVLYTVLWLRFLLIVSISRDFGVKASLRCRVASFVGVGVMYSITVIVLLLNFNGASYFVQYWDWGEKKYVNSLVWLLQAQLTLRTPGENGTPGGVLADSKLNCGFLRYYRRL